MDVSVSFFLVQILHSILLVRSYIVSKSSFFFYKEYLGDETEPNMYTCRLNESLEAAILEIREHFAFALRYHNNGLATQWSFTRDRKEVHRCDKNSQIMSVSFNIASFVIKALQTGVCGKRRPPEKNNIPNSK